MAKLIIVQPPELHADGEITLAVQCSVTTDDNVILPGFSNTVIIPFDQLQQLDQFATFEEALAYVVQQIGVVDPRYRMERLVQAEYAYYMQQVVMSNIPGYPFEIPIVVPLPDDDNPVAGLVQRGREIVDERRMS